MLFHDNIWSDHRHVQIADPALPVRYRNGLVGPLWTGPPASPDG